MKNASVFVTITVICFALLLLTLVSHAQQKVLFEDTFQDNKNQWMVFNKGKGKDKAVIENGGFSIESTKLRHFLQTIPLDDRKDYSIELVFSFSDSYSECYIGVVFEDSEYTRNKSMSFGIRGDNQSAIIEIKKEARNDIRPYAYFKDIDLSKETTFKVVRQGKITSTFLNKTLINSTDQIQLPGNAVGFIAGHGKIKIKRFSVFQENDGIHLPKEMKMPEKKIICGTIINSVKRSIALHLAPDGNTMFMDVHDKQDKDDPELYGCDDIYYSEKTSNGSWTPFEKMPAPITTISNNDLIYISPDNNTIIMPDTSCTPTSSIHFYCSHRTASGWSPLSKMRVLDAYNESATSNAVFSADGNTVLITFTMKETKGPSDIYVSHKLNDSTWSKPKDIGKTINSLGTDFPCYIAPDNKTLYFVSDGRIGYGDEDIYMTKRLDDTWLNWSEPENLGPAINGKGWDAYYIMDAKGEYAYFNSVDNGNYPDSKFFKIKLPKEIKPDPVVMVKGKVMDSKTQKPLQALIYYEILPEGKEVGVARSNPSTGEYKILLPYGKQYGYRAEAKGFITVNENFDLVEQKEYIELEKNLLLVPIEIGQTIKLNNIFFVQSKSELLSSSYPELDRLAKILKDNATINIELRGYTDNIGDPKKNIELSEERVKVVRAYLINRGISGARITGKGMGGVNPVSKDTSEEGRKLNRRVEFIITNK